MLEVLAALRNLQELDHQIFRTQAELKRLPAERAARGAELEKRGLKVSETRNEVKKLRVRIKEIEDQSTTHRQRVRKVENEAAGARQDMALLVAYQHEIRTLKRSINDCEEEGLQLVERAEELEKEAAALEAALGEENKVFAELGANLEREGAQAEKKLAELQAERKRRLSDRIPPEALQVYTRLLAAREGQAMAELDSRSCQGCYMEVPVNLVVRVTRGVELVQCPGCSRILYQRT